MHQVINTKTTTKVWTVNATDVEWIECEHVNKTGLILQLETQIHDVTSQLNSAQKKDQTNEHLQLHLEELKNKVSNEMRSRKFKLKPEQFPSRISVKRYNTSSKKAEFRCKMTQIPANSTGCGARVGGAKTLKLFHF